MDFRKKSSNLYAHFVFYPNKIFERKVLDQCNFARDHLRGLFIENNTDFVIGTHLFNCHKQCGFKGDGVQCTQDVSSSSQFGPFPAGRCYILSEPRDLITTDNHLHILVYAPSATTETKPIVSEINDANKSIGLPATETSDGVSKRNATDSNDCLT